MPQTRLVPQNFEVVSGNDKVINVTVLDENGAAVDITAATIVWAVAKRADSKNTIFFYTSPTFITILDPLLGTFRINVQDADTEPLSAQDYYHEARIVSSSGQRTTVMIGTMTVLSNVIPA